MFECNDCSTLKYDNYTARIELDLEANLLHGRVLGIQDVITFEAKDVKEIKKEFQKSIDNYCQFSKEIGREPEQPVEDKGTKLPLAVQKLIDDPNYPDNLVSEVQTSLRNVDPYTIFYLVKALGELIVSLESIKPYLKDEPDAILKVVEKLNTLLLSKKEETLSRTVAQLNSIINAKADPISDPISNRKLGSSSID
jgi:predicted HicB family RNase H-like nuclease